MTTRRGHPNRIRITRDRFTTDGGLPLHWFSRCFVSQEEWDRFTASGAYDYLPFLQRKAFESTRKRKVRPH